MRRPLLADAVCSRVMDSLTGGAFLAGLAVMAGASNLQIALLAALPFIAQVLQLPAVGLLLRFTDRRRIVAWTAGMARLAWIAIGVLAFTSALDAGRLVALVGASMALAVVATAAWNWWMRDLLPADEMGRFFGQRLRGATVASLIVMLGAGYALDQLIARGHAGAGYGALFLLGGLFGLAGIWALARTPHVRPPPSPPARETLAQIRGAMRAANPRLVAGLASGSMAVSFALPFAAIYLLRSLGYSLLAATAMAVISQVAYLSGLRGWAHISDRHGDRPAAIIAFGLLAVSLVGWALAGWDRGPTLAAFIAALHFLSGYALSGIDIATTNLMLRSAPADNAPAFLASVSVFRAAAAGLGVLAAGWLWEALGRGILWQVGSPGDTWELRGFQVLCLASVIPCILAIRSLAGLRVTSQPGMVEVARAVRREVHSMSSIAGMRAFIHAVSYSVEFMAAPFASRLKDDDLQDQSV